MQGAGFRVQGFGVRVSGFGFRILGCVLPELRFVPEAVWRGMPTARAAPSSARAAPNDSSSLHT